MSTIINGTSSAITFPDTTVQNTAFTTGAVTQSTIATGVAGTGPAFSAYQSSAQTLSASTLTKIQLQTKEFDTASAFDNVTNYRFQPTVAGYYQVSGGITVTVTVQWINVAIYKNGSAWKTLNNTFNSPVNGMFGSCLVYLNGSTDFIELYATVGAGAALSAISYSTYLQASMVRSA